MKVQNNSVLVKFATVLGLASITLLASACGMQEPHTASDLSEMNSVSETQIDLENASYADEAEGTLERRALLNKVSLNWTADETSLQKQLFDLVHFIEHGYAEVFFATVKATAGESTILCRSRESLGGEAQYMCELDGLRDLNNLVTSTNSLQGRIFEALVETTPDAIQGGSAVVKGEAGEMTCKATTLGMAQVISYACKIDVRDNNVGIDPRI